MPLVQPVGALPQHPVIFRALICQFRAISVAVTEPWVSLIVSERFSSHHGSFSSEIQAPAAYSVSRLLFAQFILISDMVRTRGGSRVRPRVRFSTPERETAAPVPTPVPSPVPEVVPDEPLGFRRYQTRMGPRAPSPVPRRRARRARPSNGPAHRAQVSHLLLGLHPHHSYHLQRRLRHHSCHRPRGSGGPCS